MSEPNLQEEFQAIQSAFKKVGREMVLIYPQAMVRGLLVLAGCVGSYLIWGGPWWQFLTLWLCVAAVIVAIEICLYLRLLKQSPDKFVTGTERQMLKFMSLIAGIGAVLSMVLLERDVYDLIPSVWMLLVGAAYVHVGLMSFSSTWRLGMVVCLGGAVSLFLPSIYSFLILALTLGVGSIIWSLVLSRKARANES